MTLPWDIEGAKKLGIVLDRYKDRYFFEVLSGVFVTYILYPFSKVKVVFRSFQSKSSEILIRRIFFLRS